MSEWDDITSAGKPNRYWRNLPPAVEHPQSVGVQSESSPAWDAIKNAPGKPYWDDPMLDRVQNRFDDQEDVTV